MVKQVQQSEPGYVFPCAFCGPEPGPDTVEHWQGRAGDEPDVLIGHHRPVAPKPVDDGW